MFKKRNIKSLNSFCLKTKITITAKQIEQTQYFTENYVLTEIQNKKILFLPEKDKQYTVDIENKQLKEIDLSVQMMQMNQVKSMIGKLTIKENFENKIKHISIKNLPASQAQLEVKMQTIIYPELEKTVYQKFNEYQQSLQMFRLNLPPDEIVKYSESFFSFNGQEQKIIVELTEIKVSDINSEEIDIYSNFKIAK